jgi:hypothetical protein
MTRLCFVLAALAAGVLAVPDLALAVTPTEGIWTTSGGESSGSFAVLGAKIVGAGASTHIITAPSTFKCNSSNLVVKTTSIKISGGKFRYEGPAYVDRFRAKTKLGHLIWSGTFTSATKVKGKIRFTSAYTPKVGGGKVTFKKKACDSGTKSWTGSVQGSSPGAGGYA